MAYVVFADWNNYTDRAGIAQTLDWDNLPSFLDIGVGLTALVQAINERLEVIVDDEEFLLTLKPFYSLADAYLIDEKLNNICLNYFNHSLDYAGNTVRSTNYYYNSIDTVLTKLEQDKITAEAFGVTSREWLKQRYDIINEILWAEVGSRNGFYGYPIAQIIYLNHKDIFSYSLTTIESDFNALAFTTSQVYGRGDTGVGQRYLRHHWGVGGSGQNIRRQIPSYDFTNVLSTKKCTKHTFSFWERQPNYDDGPPGFPIMLSPRYQDNDFFNIYNTYGYNYQNLIPESVNLVFDNDYLNYSNNTCSTGYGYFTNIPYVIFKMNVTDGFKFRL